MKPDKPYNDLIPPPPERSIIETLPILRQLVNSSVALAELKGLANILPNPNILLNAVILKEASASSEIENVITAQDKLYQPLSADTSLIVPTTKEVLRFDIGRPFYMDSILSGRKVFLTLTQLCTCQVI
jgi:hypothetical protein